MRTLRTRALLLVVLAGGGMASSRAHAEEPDDLRARYRTKVVWETQRGGWRAWIEERSDQWSRALRVGTTLLRQGPGEAAPTPLAADPARTGTDAWLHEQGWVVAAAGHRVRVFPPDAEAAPSAIGAAGILRADLPVGPGSRFLADGFLALGLPTDAGATAGLRLSWAPLRARALGAAVRVADVPGSEAARLLADTQVLVSEEPGAWVVAWMVPVPGAPLRGRARIDRTTHTATLLPPPEGPATVRVAAVQCPSVLGDVAANVKRLTALVQEAADRGAKVVVLPETAVTGYLSQDLKTTWHVPGRPRAPQFVEGKHPSTAAETVPGTSVWRFAGIARRLGIYLTVPLLEEDRSQQEPRWFNTVCLVSPQGRVVAHYRKTNPWPHPEQSWATTGDKGLVTFDTPYGRVGLAICFDVHTVLEPYSKRDLWALLHPIAWVSESDEDDATWFGRDLPRRVKSAGFHLVGANWSTDAPQPWFGAGHSLIVAKDGSVLASARTKVGPEILLADLPVRH